MTRLLCRLGWEGTIPSSVEASAAAIDHWLVPVRVNAGGAVALAVELEALLAEHPQRAFSLEWQLPEPLSPRQEGLALEALQAWLWQPRALRIGPRPLLWIHDPDRLSHPLFAARRLRTALRDRVLLLAAGPPLPAGFEAGYERSDRIPVQRLRNGLGNYESLLAHAHHRPPGDGRLLVPCVHCGSAPPMARQSPAHTAAWLTQNEAWITLSRAEPAERMVLLEQWPGRVPLPALAPPTPAPATGAAIEASEERSWGAMEPSHPAVLVHGFHLDLLARMLAPLPRQGLDLYVSTPLAQLPAAQELLEQQGWPRVRLVGVANRGRDIAPFLLELLPRALASGHPWLLKLHTKRSSHNPGGGPWGEALVHSLTNPDALAQLDQLLGQDQGVCLVAPQGALLPCTQHLAGNAEALGGPLVRHGLEPAWWLAQRFVAGSMWAARREALQPLLEQPLSLAAFEPEAGQTDGTLAHAWERLVPALLLQRRAGSLVELPAAAAAAPPFGLACALADQACGTS